MAGNDDARLRAHLDATSRKTASKKTVAKKKIVRKTERKKTVTDKSAAGDKAPPQKAVPPRKPKKSAAKKPTVRPAPSDPPPVIAPLEVMLETMRDLWARAGAEEDPAARAALRKEAASLAKDAAPYVHPRLAAVNHSGGMAVRHEDAIEDLA